MFLNESGKYRQAIQLYEAALKVLTSHEANVAGFGKGRRNQYSKIYESVSWDLQTTCFIYGSRLQEATPTDAYSVDEVEKMVADLYNRALRLCDIETLGPRQPVFQYRAASIHMKLGSLYHLKFRNEEDLKELEHGQEFLRAQTERVYLHESDLPTDKSGSHSLNNYHKKTYHTIFELLCDSLPILQAIEEAEKLPSPASKMNMIDSDANKGSPDNKHQKDEEEIHIYDVLIKKLQNNLLDLNKSLSVKHQHSKGGGKANDFLEITKKLYLQSIILKSRSATFLSDLIALLQTLKKEFLHHLR